MRRRQFTSWLVIPLVAAAAAVTGVWLGVAQTSSSSVEALQFAIVGDRTGRARPGVYEATWEAVKQARPQFVLTVGDHIEGGNDARAVSEWKEILSIWRRLGVPVFPVAGNHDVWSPASRRIWEQQTGRRTTYSFTRGSALFVVLDNSETEALGEDQLRYLETELKRHPRHRSKFVLLHKPDWLLPARFGSSEFPLHRIAKRHGVGFVLSGHLHQWVRDTVEGIEYIGVGSSGAGMERGEHRPDAFALGFFYHYVWCEMRDGKAVLEVRELGAPHGRGRSFRVP
jgi:predicted phosphodiesterase